MIPDLQKLQEHPHGPAPLHLPQIPEYAEFLVGHAHVFLVGLSVVLRLAFSDGTQLRLRMTNKRNSVNKKQLIMDDGK
jgi:hypothetical protein